mmetsp:Transcript_14639/g.31280  ORF Transcript_14639/g.31280 Transcript_14639/m.31280 type:complete len:85 (+) Transcript_14639:135-389(+)
MAESNKQFCYALSVEYPTTDLASFAYHALVVDEELHADKVTRTLRLDGATLSADFAAVDARMLRVSVNSFLEMLILASRTMDAF